MNGQIWWYTARSGGILAALLLAASVLWGLTMTTKVAGRITRPVWLLDLHRFLAAAALVFTGIHVLGILLDTYVHFGLAEVLVPTGGSDSDRPVFETALAAARLFSAHLTFVHIRIGAGQAAVNRGRTKLVRRRSPGASSASTCSPPSR